MTQTPPYLTVAVTTYMRPDLLLDALGSVIRQNFTDYELIIVDDASPDNTEEVIQQFIEQYSSHSPPIAYVRQPTNRGIDAARNVAIQHARGRFIVYLDDDDRFAPDFLHHVQRAMQSAPTTVGFAVSGRRIYRSTSTGDTLLRASDHGYQVPTYLSGDRYLEKTIGGGSGLVIRPSVALAAGGWPEDVKGGGDIDLMARMAALGDFAIIPEAVLLIYNLERTQITHSLINCGTAQERLVDRNAKQFRRFPGARVRHYRLAARMYYAANTRQDGRRCIYKALRIYPFSYRTWRLFTLLEISNFLPQVLRRRLFRHSRHAMQPG